MISAKVIADSVAYGTNNRLTTFEIEVPRIVWAEFMTHRQLSRNAASSRAIPGTKMLDQLKGKPVRFGKNQSGMQDAGEHHALVAIPFHTYEATPEEAWQEAKYSAEAFAQAFADAGYHKQVFNRLTEPFQIIKAVTSATEWDNFFWLRYDEAADPTIAALAKQMCWARDNSQPQVLKPGEYHLPYVVSGTDHEGVMRYTDGTGDPDEENKHISLEDAIKVSCARCAAVSYRNTDYDLEKCQQVYDRLVGAEKKHSSALEHCATPMEAYHFYNGVNVPDMRSTWQDGISHTDRDGNLWSGNFKGFIQHRKMVPGECYKK